MEGENENHMGLGSKPHICKFLNIGIIIFLHSLGFKVTAGFQTDLISVTDTVYLKFLNRKRCVVFITGQKEDCQEHFFIPALMIKIFLILEFSESKKPNTRRLTGYGVLIENTKI